MAMVTYSSDLLIRILANVSRDDSTCQTDTKATNDSANIQLSKIMALTQRASRLNDTADDENDIGEHQGTLATQFVAQVEGAHGAEEAACLENRHDVAFQAGMTGACLVKTEAVVEGVHCEHTADETSIPTEQHATETGDGRQEIGSTILFDVAKHLCYAGALHFARICILLYEGKSVVYIDPSNYTSLESLRSRCWRRVAQRRLLVCRKVEDEVAYVRRR